MRIVSRLVPLVAVAVVAGVVGWTPARAEVPNVLPKLYRYHLDTEASALVADGSPVHYGGLQSYAGNVVTASVDGYDRLVGSDIGGGVIGFFGAAVEQPGRILTPFGSNANGVTVAVGNLDADPAPEIVAGQETGGSLVRVFHATGDTPIAEFSAYEGGFVGGVRLAVGDVNGDGTNEVIVAPGPGRAPTVKAFSLAGALVASKDVYASEFLGGAFVAAANLDADATWEVVTGAGAGAGPHVRVFDGLGDAQSGGFYAFALTDLAGVRVAAGQVGGQPAIVATTREPAVSEVRVFTPLGNPLTQPFTVPTGDGDLSASIQETTGEIELFDAAPRLIGVSPTTLRDHTRGTFTIYGAGLGALVEDGTIGSETDPIFVTGLRSDADNLVVTYAVAAGVSPGVAPISLQVRSPGGTAVHSLDTNALSVLSRATPLDAFVTTGVVSFGGPHVRTFTSDGPIGGGFFASGDSGGGVRVARGDLDGDGVDEIITGAGVGQLPMVRVFGTNGALRSQFQAYGSDYTGGVFVAVGDVDPTSPGNEIISAPDVGGGPHVKVFTQSANGAVLQQFFAYSPSFSGGVRLATADIDGDGIMEIITGAGPGGAPHVQALTETGAQLLSFYAYGVDFSGGVFVAGADLTGQGIDEIITGPGAGGGPHVKIFLQGSAIGPGFMAFNPNFAGGISVARIGDEIIGPDYIAVGAGPGGGPHVKVVDGDGAIVDSFYAYDAAFNGGVFVAGGLA
ncbi:MAG: fibronectin-binding autotransporter adhesin [Actinomycetota bacterium]|jgi:hypothetical protein